MEIEYIDPLNSMEFNIVENQGRVRHIVLVPSSAKVAQDTERAIQEAYDTRRMVAAKQGQASFVSNGIEANFQLGGVFFNRIEQTAGGQQQAGRPYVHSQGYTLYDSNMVTKVLEAIRALPETERFLIAQRNFANFEVTIDVDGDGIKERVLTTVIFPIDQDVIATRVNPESNVTEIEVYRNGLLRFVATGNRITVPDYDRTTNVEQSTISYYNPVTFEGNYSRYADLQTFVQKVTEYLGTNPARTAETYTSAYRVNDYYRQAVDPKAAIATKVNVNYMTGEFRSETYGLYRQPIRIVTDKSIVENQYNANGLFRFSREYDNGREAAVPARLTVQQLLQRVTQPVTGQLRFENRTPVELNTADLSATGYNTTVQRVDVVKGLSTYATFENAELGRKLVSFYTDRFKDLNGADQSITVAAKPLYSNQFYAGEVPYATVIYNAETGRQLATLVMTNYDRVTRRSTFRETDHTKGNAVRTLVFDHRYDAPVTVSSVDLEGRRWVTTNSHNRTETETQSTTTVAGKVAITSTSTFDAATKAVNTQERKWVDYANRVYQERSSSVNTAYGRMLYRTVDFQDGINRRYYPIYNQDGVEIGGRGYKFSPTLNRWVGEFNYSNYRYSRGELTRTKTELLYLTNRNLEEVISFQGLPRKDVDLIVTLQDRQGRDAGVAKRTTTYIYGGQYPLLASRGTTGIEVRYADGRTENIVYTQSELDKFEAVRLADGTLAGRITLKLVDVSREGYTTYEVKDIYRRNRTVESSRQFTQDVIDLNNPVFTQNSLNLDKRTYYSYTGELVLSNGLPLSFYEIADVKATYVLDETNKTSRLLYAARATGFDLADRTVTDLKRHYLVTGQPAWDEVTRTDILGRTIFQEAYLKNFKNEQALKVTYTIHADEAIGYQPLPAAGNRSLNLAVPGTSGNIQGYDYLRFFVDSDVRESVYDGIELHLVDGSGREVVFKSRIADKTAYFRDIENIRTNRVLPFIYPSPTHTIATPQQEGVLRVTGVVADYMTLSGKNPFVVPVQWLRDVGFDVTSVKSARIVYTGSQASHITVSSMTLLGEGTVKSQPRRLNVLTDELQRLITDANIFINIKQEPLAGLTPSLEQLLSDNNIHFNANGTVSIEQGYHDRQAAEKRRTFHKYFTDGRKFLSSYDRDEGKGITTPITSSYIFDEIKEDAIPEFNLYSGYPGFDHAEIIFNVENGVGRAYYKPNGFAVASVQIYDPSVIENKPDVTVYGGQIVVPGRKQNFINELTYNDLYMTIARSVLGVQDPLYKYDARDNMIERLMSNVTWQRDYLAAKQHPSALFNNKPVFWNTNTLAGTPVQPVDRSAFINSIEQLRKGSRTGFIPTAPGTASERYVETVKMGEIISSLIAAGDTRIAEDILLGSNNSIYRITNGGRLPLANFYEINTATPFRSQPEFNGSYPATVTFESQVAMANASLTLWKATGNEYARELAINLVRGAMKEFYPAVENDNTRNVGAFSQLRYEASILNGELQSKPEVYEVRANAKMYLLLNTMEAALGNTPQTAALRADMAVKKAALRQWFSTNILPRVIQDGVVSLGMF
jgi:hypothetical protein